MPANLDLIERLRLAPDAGERDVRRAYAQALKLIDQERDLAGFQYLRECYEAALEWVRWRDAHDAPDEGGPPMASRASAAVPSVPPALDPDSPQALSAAVFAALHARMASLATPRDNGPLDDEIRTARWTGALRETLADPRLLNLDARQLFELRVAALLAGGWRSGHHLLFAAADTVFGWSCDGNSLERLGYPGAVVAAALNERAMSRSLQFKQRMDQRNLLALLRAGTPPDNGTVKEYVIALRMLDTHFPHLLALMAPCDVLPKWRTMGAALPVETLAKLASAQRRGPRRDLPAFAFGLLLLLSIIAQMSYQDAHSARPAAPAPESPVETITVERSPDPEGEGRR